MLRKMHVRRQFSWVFRGRLGDASSAGKSSREARMCVGLKRDFMENTACIKSTCTSDLTHV